MPRIRSIKPEFCTSEQVADCSPTARLLFILMWLHCDDQGVHPASPRSLKMECFPADPFTTDQMCAWISELLASGLLIEYEIAGRPYWFVTGWKHQKIEKPNRKYPPPPPIKQIDDESENVRRPVDDSSPEEGKGREGSNSKDFALRANVTFPENPGTVTGDVVPIVEPPKRATIPLSKIVALYHEILPTLPRVEKITRVRAGLIQQRWREDLPDLDHWRNFFNFVARSDFLMGRSKPTDPARTPFRADLEWLTRPQNFAKIAEEKYHQKRGAA